MSEIKVSSVELYAQTYSNLTLQNHQCSDGSGSIGMCKYSPGSCNVSDQGVCDTKGGTRLVPD